MAPDQDDFPHDSLSEALAAEAGLRGVARALLADPQAAEDAVQHAWLRWLQHGRGVPLPFLRRAVRNEAIDQRRSRARRTARETDAAREDLAPSAAEMVAGEQERRRLWAAVHALDEPYRGTIWLCFYEDLPPRAVAKRLGVPVETVRTRTRRGLEMLRQRLEQEGGSDWRGRLAMAFGLPLLVAWSPVPLLVGVAAAAVLCVGLAVAWPGQRQAEAVGEGAGRVARVADLQALGEQRSRPVSKGVAKAERRTVEIEVPQAEPEPESVHRLQVVHADNRPARGLPVWLWDRPMPRQAWLPERESTLGTAMHALVVPPREPEGIRTAAWTDGDGRCRLLAEAAYGVTVGLDDFTWVSFAGVPERIVLPPLADLTIDVLPHADSASYSLRLYPARQDNPEDPSSYEYAATDVRSITTASGPAVLFLQRHLLTDLDSRERVTIRLPEGELFCPEVDAFPLRMRAMQSGVRAPAALELRVDADAPTLMVEVFEADGSRYGRAGIVRVQPAGATDGRGYGLADLEAGLAVLAVAEPRNRNELLVMLEDGELFRRELAPMDATGVSCRFVRGEGLAGEEVELPPQAAGLHFVSLVLERSDGRLECVPEPSSLLFLPGEPDSTWSVRGTRLRLCAFPEGWRRGWLCADDGTMFRLDAGVGSAIAEPCSASSLLDLDRVHEGRGRPAYAGYSLMLVFREAGDKDVEVPLRWLRVDPLSDELPSWTWRRSPIAELRLQASGVGGRTKLPLPR